MFQCELFRKIKSGHKLYYKPITKREPDSDCQWKISFFLLIHDFQTKAAIHVNVAFHAQFSFIEWIAICEPEPPNPWPMTIFRVLTYSFSKVILVFICWNNWRHNMSKGHAVNLVNGAWCTLYEYLQSPSVMALLFLSLMEFARDNVFSLTFHT